MFKTPFLQVQSASVDILVQELDMDYQNRGPILFSIVVLVDHNGIHFTVCHYVSTLV